MGEENKEMRVDLEAAELASTEETAEPKEKRSAEDYINAANAVIDIATLALPLIPGGKVAVAAAAAVKFAPAAKQILQKLPDMAPVAQKAAGAIQEKAPEAVNAGAGAVFGAVKGAVDTVGGAVGGIGHVAGDKIKGTFDARAQEKARREARRTLLDGAGIRMSVSQFMENWNNQAKLQQADSDYLAYSGCYAIATYGGAVRNDDFGSFKEIYIGKSENMGKSIHADIVGLGNVDVYADVKYKQHVYVLLYPAEAEKLDTLEQSLITALDADSSYNKAKA